MNRRIDSSTSVRCVLPSCKGDAAYLAGVAAYSGLGAAKSDPTDLIAPARLALTLEPAPLMAEPARSDGVALFSEGDRLSRAPSDCTAAAPVIDTKRRAGAGIDEGVAESCDGW